MLNVNLDLRTLVFATTFVELVMAAILVLFWRNQRSFPGIALVAAAAILAVLGTLLIGFRPVIPLAVSIMGSNWCILGAFLLYFYGLQRVRGVPGRPLFAAAILAIVTLEAGFFTFVRFDTAARIENASVLMAIVMFVGVFDLVREARPHLTMACRTLAGLAMVHGVYHVINAVTTSVVGADPHLLATHSGVRLLQPFFAMGMTICWGLGFLWIAYNILQARLRQAEKMEAVGRLAGGIAHELNNMLFPIIGLTTMVREWLPEGAEEREDLGVVIEAAEQAADIVRRILVFSRPDGASRERIDLADVVRQAVEQLRPTLPSTVALEDRIDETTGVILADVEHVRTIIMTLASNAIDAMHGTSGQLEVALARVDVAPALVVAVPGLAAGTYARLGMTDTGCGMDATTVRRAADPFFTTKEVGKGTGLGLSVVNGLVSAMSGALRLVSRPGAGTMVEIYLPLAGD